MTISIKKLNKTKTPIVKINDKLDKLAEKVLFPEKLKRANETLKRVGLPKTHSR
jgi:hypothetical protein